MNYLLALVAAGIIASAPPARAEQAACPDVAGRGGLNVLTINILYTDMLQRLERLQAVADFIAGRTDNETVDIVLLQEVVSGALALTPSAGINLKLMLQRRGLDYNLRLRPVAGLPGLFMVGNAMLSRCEITAFASRLLPYAGEMVAGLRAPVLHEVQMIGIDVPGYGAASVYNTHLCSFCSGDDRLRQTESLFDFLDRREGTAHRLVVLGGDFNTDVTVAADLPAYDLITQDRGFTDTYAAAGGCADCCSEAEGLVGCTYAVPGNPLAGGAPSVRIDYIFAQGDFSGLASTVVFNEEPWVSDHSGVLTEIRLPQE